MEEAVEFSAERRAEGYKRVRCTRMLGRRLSLATDDDRDKQITK